MNRNFEDFLAEAKRREERSGVRREPWKMTLKDKSVIAVPAPDAMTLLALGQVKEGDILGQLRVLFNDRNKDFFRLMEEFKGAPANILNLLIQDMQEFWGDGEDLSAGKSDK